MMKDKKYTSPFLPGRIVLTVFYCFQAAESMRERGGGGGGGEDQSLRRHIFFPAADTATDNANRETMRNNNYTALLLVWRNGTRAEERFEAFSKTATIIHVEC